MAFICLLPVVLCTILRLPCMTIADFTVTEFGKRLTDSVISRHYHTTDVQCTILCVQNERCRSYNIQRAKLICELNGKAMADAGTEASNDLEWLYGSTNYSSPLVGPTCKELRPCENGILCRDKCSQPYYECIYCDNKHTGLHCDIEKEINECETSPCENAAECVDERFGYKCICKAGFTGKNCENDVNECDSLPCLKGGACQNYAGGYNCTCAYGYVGIHCDVYDDCVSSPCQFYQRCVNGISTYSCETLTNVALYKKASQSSTIYGYASAIAHNAVDGRDSSIFSHGSCSHTLEEQKPWWDVDFGRIYSITGVEITNRGDGYGLRLKNFTVTVDESLCFHRSEAVPDAAVIKVPCSSVLKDINECLSNPCQDGGTCIDFYNRYSCKCAAGYNGANCQGS